MKQLFLFLFNASLLLFASSFKTASNDQTANGDQPKIEVVFNSQMKIDDLVKIKSDLSQKEIVLNYRKLEFDENGKLCLINFYVDCKDGFKGGAESTLSNQRRFGFYRDYSKDVATPFEAGNL
jgi:hypothetical protein